VLAIQDHLLTLVIAVEVTQVVVVAAVVNRTTNLSKGHSSACRG
jgi:hypothetical protein